MPYTPRTTTEILRSLRAGFIGRSSATDLNRSSAITMLLSSVAEEVASIERRLFTFKESFFLNGAIGTDLDERVAQLPPVGISRIQKTNASASALRIDRDPTDTSSALIIPAGSIVSRTNGVRYQTTQAVVFSVGQSSLTNVYIVCTEAGINGNAPIGTINNIVSMPSGVISVTNEQALTNGTDRETDAQLKKRALTYLKSLSRTSKTTLEFLGTSFIGSQGERYQYAKVYEDPTRPGYAELCVDDGSGLIVSSISKPGLSVTTAIANGGQAVVYHEAPATAPITPSNLTITRGAASISVSSNDFVSIQERGAIYFNEGVLQAGDVISINGYRVFTGLISELQQEIEGDPSNYDKLSGFRPAGTRVVVKPVQAEFISLDLKIDVFQASDYSVVELLVIDAIGTYVNALAPGQTLYISKLVELCASISGVRDIRFFNPGTSEHANNITPTSTRSVLRVRSNSLNISQN